MFCLFLKKSKNHLHCFKLMMTHLFMMIELLNFLFNLSFPLEITEQVKFFDLKRKKKLLEN